MKTLFGDTATPNAGLKAPQERAYWEVVDAIRAGKNVVFQAPCGGGKTRMSSELLRWAERDLGGGEFYLNRKSLVMQTRDAFTDAGLYFGVRAADHEDGFDPDAAIQIGSADTEASRVYSKGIWKRHDCGLVIIDEAHIQKGDRMKTILEDHLSNGAQAILLSATPVALKKLLPNPHLVQAGSLKEFRACGLLVPAVVKSIEQPDLSKVKRSQTGEYVLNGEARKIYTQTIVGNVIDRWKRYNPDARPTMLYAPGVAESVWFTDQFRAAGVSWCHVDATDAHFDGKRYSLNRSLWGEILEKYQDGTFKGISSRFRLREGVDVPSTFHIILATPIGSLTSYLQTVGRGLRAAPGKDHAIITDHGGNYLRHGSPNHDRPWELLWQMSSNHASKLHANSVAEGETPEPIRCPNCEGERAFGIKCPHCGHVHAKSQRHVIYADGRMVTKDGNLMPRRVCVVRSDTQEKWTSMYFGFWNKKVKKSFNEMRGFFCKEYGYWPPKDMAFMPKTEMGWNTHVHAVPRDSLWSAKQPN